MPEPEKLSFQKLGKYEVVDKIGQGSFGVVFRGVDPFLKRQVAIKVCSVGDQELRRRFFREAEIAGKLQHKNIVTVFAFGLEGDVPYLVQEFLPGEDLDVVIKQRAPLTPDEKLDYLCQIGEGLEYAHSQGVVHRDIKPGNLRLLADGGLKIMDFGIAKLASAETQLTQKGVTMGTASYLPPEQVRGGDVDHRADVFSFGVLAYELLAYERPFRGNTLSALVYQILYKVPAPISSLWTDCPQELSELVARCLEKKPDRRPTGFGEILSILHEVRRGIASGRWPALRQAPVKPALRPAKIEASDVLSQTAIARTVREVTGGGVDAAAAVARARARAEATPAETPSASTPPPGGPSPPAPVSVGAAPPPPPPVPRPPTAAAPLIALPFDGDATQPVAALARGLDEQPTTRMTAPITPAAASALLEPATVRLSVGGTPAPPAPPSAPAPASEPPTVALPPRPGPREEPPTVRLAIPEPPAPPPPPSAPPAPPSLRPSQATPPPLEPALADVGREIADLVAKGDLEAAREELERTMASRRKGETHTPTPAPPAFVVPVPTPPPAPREATGASGFELLSPLQPAPAVPAAADGSFLTSTSGAAPGGSDVYRTAVRDRRRWLLWGGVAATLVVVVIGLAVVLGGGEKPAPVVAPPAPPPPTSAAPALASGFLVVDAVPWATVTEVTNGQGFVQPLPADATTPLRLELPPGRYTVRLARPAEPGLAACEAEVSLGGLATCAPPAAGVDATRYFKETGWWR